jgi:hypothetical protein
MIPATLASASTRPLVLAATAATPSPVATSAVTGVVRPYRAVWGVLLLTGPTGGTWRSAVIPRVWTRDQVRSAGRGSGGG